MTPSTKCAHCGAWLDQAHRSFCNRPTTVLRDGLRQGADSPPEVCVTRDVYVPAPRSCCGKYGSQPHSSVCLQRFDMPSKDVIELVRTTPPKLRVAAVPVAPSPSREIPPPTNGNYYEEIRRVSTPVSPTSPTSPMDDAWEEIIGETVRGRLGVGQRSCQLPPRARMLTRSPEQDWQLPLRHSGKSGQRVCVNVTPSCRFRAEVAYSNDTAGGRGTRIHRVWVGNNEQFGLSIPVLSCYARNSLLNIDICEANVAITMDVEFLTTCQWYCTLLGKVVV